MNKIHFFPFFFFIILSEFSFAQVNHFVSINGNDNNAGTHQNPWATIQFAIDESAEFDTINVVQGIYNEKIYIDKGITIRGFSQNYFTINAEGIAEPEAIIEVENAGFVNLQYTQINNNVRNDAIGILIQGNTHHIKIENCEITNIHFSDNPQDLVTENTNAQPIIVFGNTETPIHHLSILNTKVSNCRLGYSEAISVNGNVDGFEIIGCTVDSVTNIGIDAIGFEGVCPNPILDQTRNGRIAKNHVKGCNSEYATSAGIYVDGAKNILIERNYCEQNGFGIEVGCEHPGKSADSILVRNNICTLNFSAGLAIGGYDFPNGSGKVTHVAALNNTLDNNGTASAEEPQVYLSYSENCIIANNLIRSPFPNHHIFTELNPQNLLMDYNSFGNSNSMGNNFFNASWNGTEYNSLLTFSEQSFTNQHSILDSSIFENSQNCLYSLNANSNTMNAGNNNFISQLGEVDYCGNTRLNQTIDIGATEFNTELGYASIDNIQPIFYPNPLKDILYFKLGNEEVIKVEVLDLTGKLLLMQVVNAAKSIDMNDFAAGLYCIKIIEKKGITISKLIKV
jgi:hypothetical protein